MLLTELRETSAHTDTSGIHQLDLGDAPTLPLFAYHLHDTAKLANANTVRLPAIGSRPITRRQFVSVERLFSHR